MQELELSEKIALRNNLFMAQKPPCLRPLATITILCSDPGHYTMTCAEWTRLRFTVSTTKGLPSWKLCCPSWKGFFERPPPVLFNCQHPMSPARRIFGMTPCPTHVRRMTALPKNTPLSRGSLGHPSGGSFRAFHHTLATLEYHKERQDDH
ncbi:hypothetical protein E2C01_017206 [Portunus trituberculatus]|uniref:Uncharacterized protein n=1 Tax=Portunus trituberculatus TaxID=210409 RepID=A0A5B7DSS4_PORTR|nr:hypothetical protein [Portunus trituberculatus]